MRAPYNLSRVERLHGVIRGDVQGVGFRYFLVREAHGLGLRGWVRNRDDGTVEFVAEGARKSTTMRILAGFLGLSAGNASVDGYDVFSHSLDVRKRIGYLPETTPLYNEMRVAGFLDLMCRLRGVSPSLRRARIDHAIEVCGLADRSSEIIGRLSKGLRQRVGVAQAIVHDPKALIPDR